MKPYNESLLFPLSDAMQIPLFLTGSTFRSVSEKAFKAGPWTMISKCKGRSDELGPQRASFLLRIKGELWFYLVCDESGNRLHCFALSGPRVGLKSASDSDKVCAGNTGTTLSNLFKGVVAAFEFSDNMWNELNVSSDLVQRFQD